MGKLKDQLAGIAALIAAVVAIGGGFATYGKLTEKINVLESRSTTDYSAQIAVLEEKVEALSVKHGHMNIQINKKEIELLKVQIEEIKVKSSNPLATN
jgi:outer membrane murein-binding lipoprotein Lpp|tara:strand:+ start:107 stop:400 length:294 start_codon:yes stop_codon:yes gene_type:complete